MNFIIANIFSAIGTFFLAYSTFLKTKNNMLKYQIFDSMFNALGNIFIGSFTGALSNTITIIRNLLNTKGKMTKSLNFILYKSYKTKKKKRTVCPKPFFSLTNY